MSRSMAIAAVWIIVSLGSASAEDKMVVDMRKMSCGELTKLGFQDFAGITMWLGRSWRICTNHSPRSVSTAAMPSASATWLNSISSLTMDLDLATSVTLSVSYTHLTLPTIYPVSISVAPVSLKKKTLTSIEPPPAR